MSRPGHWPTHTALWILRAALLETGPARLAWRRVAATADIETIDPGAARLLPLLQPRALLLGVVNPWRDRVRGIYRYWWAHDQLLIRVCAQALFALDRAGIATMVLKGVPLALAYYRDPGLRPMSDIDVLVRPDDARRALATLSRHGWLPEKRVDDAYLRNLHGVSLHNDAGRTLDLHWFAHEDDVGPNADDRVWADARPIDIAGAQSLMPSAASLLVHAFASGAKWAADPAVRWLPDAAFIIRDGAVDWDAFVDEVARRRFTVRVRSCLRYLELALGVSPPAAAAARLEALPTSDFERIEHRLRTQPQRLLGELPRYWLDWARSDPGAWRDLPGFAHYLRNAWDLESVWAVPAAAAERALRRLVRGEEHALATQNQRGRGLMPTSPPPPYGPPPSTWER